MASGGAAFATRLLWKKLDGKSVAILGARGVGKTALLSTLQHGDLPNRSITSGELGFDGKFSMEVNGKTVAFDTPRDLAGNDADVGFKRWKEAFLGADYVWYVFRADLIAQGDSETIERVSGHLNRFKDWMLSSKAGHPSIVLIGTHADNAPEYGHDAAAFAEMVRSSAAIKLGLVKLNHAGLVVGSLSTINEAKKLVKELRGELQ
jgi:hypothetical protein